MMAIALVFFAAIVAALVGFVRRRRVAARVVGDAAILRHLLGSDPERTPWERIIPVALAAIALALALLDPRLATAREGHRGPVVLLLDASGSMLVEDVGVERIELQRAFSRRLVTALPEVSVGIVTFAGRAYSLTPPTRDRGAVEMYLDALDPTIVTQSGSALAAAIRQGIGLLTSAPFNGGTIVLISDGDETEDAAAAMDAARLASRSGVRVHTVGVGTLTGGAVPAINLGTGTAEGWLREPDGELLISRLDQNLLGSIAREGGGIFLLADDDPERIGSLTAEILGERTTSETNEGIPPYMLLSAVAFLFMLLEPVMAEFWRRR